MLGDGAPLNDSIAEVLRLCRTLAYLQTAQAELLNSTAVSSGLRPFEVRLPSGCIQETDANFKGDLVSGVLNNTRDGDQCCQQCRWPFSYGVCDLQDHAFPQIQHFNLYSRHVLTIDLQSPPTSCCMRAPL